MKACIFLRFRTFSSIILLFSLLSPSGTSTKQNWSFQIQLLNLFYLILSNFASPPNCLFLHELSGCGFFDKPDFVFFSGYFYYLESIFKLYKCISIHYHCKTLNAEKNLNSHTPPLSFQLSFPKVTTVISLGFFPSDLVLWLHLHVYIFILKYVLFLLYINGFKLKLLSHNFLLPYSVSWRFSMSVDIYLFLTPTQHFIIQMYHNLFAHSCTEEYLHCSSFFLFYK